MENPNRILAKLNKARWKYESVISELKESLNGKIEFDFSVEYQQADGHMILDVENQDNIAPAADCLSVIYRKGSLSVEDHLKLCI